MNNLGTNFDQLNSNITCLLEKFSLLLALREENEELKKQICEESKKISENQEVTEPSSHQDSIDFDDENSFFTAECVEFSSYSKE
uniref:Uncharacterized protein n=1 Tax=Strongyloides stercoralis TaxID=6248 RepID=A0A0K0EK95_STRER